MEFTTNSNENYDGIKSYSIPEEYSEIECPISFGELKYRTHNSDNYTFKQPYNNCFLGTNIYTNPEKVNLEIMANSRYLPDNNSNTQPIGYMNFGSIVSLTSYSDSLDIMAALFKRIRKEEENTFYKKRKKSHMLQAV